MGIDSIGVGGASGDTRHGRKEIRTAKHLIPSNDGTPIAVWRTGQGPALMLVHGMVADHSTTWRRVLPDLEREFTVYTMDRRGRGGSGDSPNYALQREAEDVAAVVDAMDRPVFLVGHSFGGLCAAEAARLTSKVERLLVYEGMMIRGTDVVPEGLAARFEEMLKDGRVEEMLLTFLRDFVGLGEPEIEMLQSEERAWSRRLENAPTIPREMEAQERYVFAPDRFAAMTVPVVLLVGGDSPRLELVTAQAVAGGLPNAEVSVMTGQEHLAMYTAPAQFIQELVRFA